ncbi:MAG: SMP-30/gluconolactonase/LRE family protein [Eubacterium sp.]|nr:SMP-30/gluconolactonase/LRE family protein [Eubacterium sp.]
MEIKKYHANVFSEEKFMLGESPFYDSRTNLISWVDIMAGKFYTQSLTDSKGNTNTDFLVTKETCNEYSINQEIGFSLPTLKGSTYLIGGTDGLYSLSCPDGKLQKIIDLTNEFESYQRCNDAKADPMGRLWFGSSVLDDSGHEACGNLYLLQGEKPIIKQANTLISNGMAWNKARDKFYFSDSLYHAVFVYDYDIESANILNRKSLFEIEDGVPDGLCIDSNDNLWVAIWGGRRIEHRSGSDGSLIGLISVDSNNVTSCCFMGDKMDTLLITSSGNGEKGQNDGKLFTCKLDVTGPDPNYFNLPNTPRKPFKETDLMVNLLSDQTKWNRWTLS